MLIRDAQAMLQPCFINVSYRKNALVDDVGLVLFRSLLTGFLQW